MPSENMRSHPHNHHTFARQMRAELGTSCQRGTTPPCSCSEISQRASTRSTCSSMLASTASPPKLLHTLPIGLSMRCASAAYTRWRCSIAAVRAPSSCVELGRHAACAASNGERGFGKPEVSATGAPLSSRTILVMHSSFSAPARLESRTWMIRAARCGLSAIACEITFTPRTLR